MTVEISEAEMSVVENGVCLLPIRLLDYNCMECKYFDKCNVVRKGKELTAKYYVIAMKENKKNKKEKKK